MKCMVSGFFTLLKTILQQALSEKNIDTAVIVLYLC